MNVPPREPTGIKGIAMNEVEQLTERVQFLEQQMKELRGAIAYSSSVPGWKRKAGLFARGEAFTEIVRLGAKIRRQDRSGRRKPPSRRTARTGKGGKAAAGTKRAG